MQTNVIKMVSELGIPERLGIPAQDFFAPAHGHLLHMTSTVRRPVFVKKKGDLANYSGYGPRLMDSPLLRGCVETDLAEELRLLRHALVIPFGNSVSEALQHLASQGIIKAEQCLIGFPHPAGGNAHRPRLFNERKDEFRQKVDAWFGGRQETDNGNLAAGPTTGGEDNFYS